MAKKKINKIDINRVKDPKKQAGGRARAASSLRINGQFTSNKFLEDVTEKAAMVGIKDPEKVKDFYIQNEKQFSNVWQQEELTTLKSYDDLRKIIKNFNGKSFKNGKQVKKNTLLKSLSELKTYLKVEHMAVEMYTQLSISLDGKLRVKIPTIKSIRQQLEEGINIEDILDDNDIGIIVSPTTEKEDNKLGINREKLNAK